MDVATKLLLIRRAPAGAALAASALDQDKLIGFIATRSTGQNGGEGVTPAEFTPALLEGTPKFFGNRLCPFAHRAYWTLVEKGALRDGLVQYVHINLGAEKPAWYKDSVYYKGSVPSFASEGVVVGESAVVVELLEDLYPAPRTPLLPTSPVLRAAVRFLVKTFDGHIPALFGVLMNKDGSADATKTDAALAALREIETLFEKQSPAGPYFLGDALSAADVAVVPFLARFSITLPFYRGVDLLELGGFVRLKAVLEACAARPAFAATFPPAEYIASAYYSYAGGDA